MLLCAKFVNFAQVKNEQKKQLFVLVDGTFCIGISTVDLCLQLTLVLVFLSDREKWELLVLCSYLFLLFGIPKAGSIR